MAESQLSQLLKKKGQPDPMANIGTGSYGMQIPQNPILEGVKTVGDYFTPDYLKNPNPNLSSEELNTPNENWKLPRYQADNPLPWMAIDLASAIPSGAAKVAAPIMKSMFFGPMAATANLVKLAKAKEMAAEGANTILKWRNPVTKEPLGSNTGTEIPGALRARDKQIYNETGWFRRPDSKWRTPISDARAHSSALGFALGKDPKGVPLDRVLKHDALYQGYPEFKDIQFYTLPENAKFLGAYHPDGLLGAKYTPNPGRTSTMLHEGQHAIQGVEDFAPGGNSAYLADYGKKVLGSKGISEPYSPEVTQKLKDAAFNLYQRHSGEEESRMVQRLFEMHPELRSQAAPHNSLIGRSQQVVPGDWLAKQTPETQEFIKNTMTHQFQGGPPTLENYIKLLMQDAK